MVQILPRTPSLGELLGGGMGQGMTQGFEQMRQGGALGELLGLKPEETQALGRMPAQMQQMLGTALMKSHLQQAEDKNLFETLQRYKQTKGQMPGQVGQAGTGGGMGEETPSAGADQPNRFVPPNDPDLIHALSGSSRKAYQNMGKTLMEENKMAAKQWNAERTLALKEQKASGLIPTEKAQSYLSTTKKMRELLPYTGSALWPGKSFGGKKTAEGIAVNRLSLQKRAQFDAMTPKLINLFRDLDSKGQFSFSFMEKLSENLPNSNLSDRENIGRIEGIEEIVKGLMKGDLKEVEEKVYALSEGKQVSAEKNFSIGNTFDSFPKNAPIGTYVKDDNGKLFKKTKDGWSPQ